MSCCDQATITDAAFVHLAGIHTLIMSCCNNTTSITDAAFAHLRGIHTLDVSMINITDAAFAHLRGIHTLIMFGCARVSGVAMEHLLGISVLDITFCRRITKQSLTQLKRMNRRLKIENDPSPASLTKKITAIVGAKEDFWLLPRSVLDDDKLVAQLNGMHVHIRNTLLWELSN